MKKLYTLLLIAGLSFAFVNSCLAQAPVAAFSCNDSSTCLFGCINFTNLSTNATSYKWIFQGGTPAMSTDTSPQVCYDDSIGTFTVTLIASNSTGSDTLIENNFIVVHPSPPVPYIYQHADTLFCTTDSSYVSYQWYKDVTLIPGATDTFLVITQSYNYNILVTNNFGCSIAVGINNFEGIMNIADENAFSIYPNPATNELNVHIYDSPGNKISVIIINTIGEAMNTVSSLLTNTGGVASVNISAFPPGIYFADFRSGRERWVKKFVKE